MDLARKSIELVIIIRGCENYRHAKRINHGHIGLVLVREPSKHDDDAIRVVDGDNQTVGFVDARHAKRIAPLLDSFLFECFSVCNVRVMNSYHMSASIHLRPLLCAM